MVTNPPTSARIPSRANEGAEPRHKPELDGIRGIAVLLVMLSHGGGWYILQKTLISKLFVYAMVPGWCGVELFFVLSGFLITGILLRTKRAENYFSAFYVRRFLRIFPIYYTVVIVGLLVASHNAWWNSMLPSLERTRISYFFYAQNWPFAWGHSAYLKTNVFGHFWSLAVEEQFYLIWPLVIWLLPEKWVLRLCIAGLVVALPLRFYMVPHYAESLLAMVLTTSRMDGLLVGAILAIVLRRGQIRLRWVYALLASGATPIGYIAIFHHHELIDTYYWMPTIGITGFSLLMGGLLAMSQQPIRWLQRVLTAGWLRVTGKYSYGMYIYHIPIYLVLEHVLVTKLGVRFPMPLPLALLYIAALIGITFLVAKISYEFFESPILSLKTHFRPKFATTEPTKGESFSMVSQ